MTRTISPFRYPGGKSVLINYLKVVMEINQLRNKPVVEVFAGGAGLSLGLLQSDWASEIFLNDLNPAMSNFWQTACLQSESLCDLIDQTQITMDQWVIAKGRFQEIPESNRLQHAFATLFLNRTNRNGIFNAGVMGGNDQSGRYKMDSRFNKQAIIDKILWIGRNRDRIHTSSLDAVDFLRNRSLPSDALLYLDPPYYNKGRLLYDTYYQSEDHAHLASVIQKHPAQWLMSYDNAPPIKSLYPQRRCVDFDLRYSINNSSSGSETLIACDTLLLPECHSPVSINPIDYFALPINDQLDNRASAAVQTHKKCDHRLPPLVDNCPTTLA